MLRRLRSYLLVSMVAVLSCNLRVSAYGAQYRFINDLVNQFRYDSNILFSRSNEIEDWIYEVIPRLGLERRDELSDVRLKARFRGQLFFRENGLNTLDQDYSIALKRVLSERFTFDLNGFYIVDTTTDRELVETGTLLSRNNRTHYSVAPALEWSFREADTVSVSVPFLWTNYDGTRYVDYRTTYVTLTYTHLFHDMRTSIIVQPQYAYLKFANSETDMYDLMVGLGRHETERLEWGILAGANYSESTYDSYRFRPIAENVYIMESYEDTSYDLQWLAMAHINWQYEAGSVKARFSRIVSESGYGEAVTRLRFTSRIDHRWTERFTLYLDGQYSRVEDQSSGKRVDYALYEIRPGCNYRLTENVNVGFYYRYSLEDTKRLSDTFDRHLFCVRFEIKDMARAFK